MFLVWIGIYTLIMVIVWGFFLVAKMHAYKFREYSHLVTPMTKLLAVFLIVLTGFGYYFLARMNNTASVEKTQTIEESTTQEIY